VNDQAIPLVAWQTLSGPTHFQGTVPSNAYVGHKPFARLRFELERTVVPSTLNPSSIDTRPVGLAISRLKVTPAPQPSALAAFVEAINQTGGTYHKLNLAPGLTISGYYDLDRYVQNYDLPKDLHGKAVLDIGTASGYFALECARRGASVTAIDVWDSPIVPLAQLLRLPVEYIKKSIYDLDAAFGQFDLVICGSLLLHLVDPLGAIHRIRSVCRETAMVSTSCPTDSTTNARPMLDFLGLKATDGNYWTYWNINSAALEKMLLAAGFSRIVRTSHFTLRTEPGYGPYEVPHVVMTAIV
jgi:tRNA (mo5U34)-methyltransferase